MIDPRLRVGNLISCPEFARGHYRYEVVSESPYLVYSVVEGDTILYTGGQYAGGKYTQSYVTEAEGSPPWEVTYRRTVSIDTSWHKPELAEMVFRIRSIEYKPSADGYWSCLVIADSDEGVTIQFEASPNLNTGTNIRDLKLHEG